MPAVHIWVVEDQNEPNVPEVTICVRDNTALRLHASLIFTFTLEKQLTPDRKACQMHLAAVRKPIL